MSLSLHECPLLEVQYVRYTEVPLQYIVYTQAVWAVVCGIIVPVLLVIK